MGGEEKFSFKEKSVVCIGTRPDQLCDFSLLDPEFNRGPSVPFMRSTCKRLCDHFKFTSWVLCQSFMLLAFRGFFKLWRESNRFVASQLSTLQLPILHIFLIFGFIFGWRQRKTVPCPETGHWWNGWWWGSQWNVALHFHPSVRRYHYDILRSSSSPLLLFISSGTPLTISHLFLLKFPSHGF
jgi:hypothetical protein